MNSPTAWPTKPQYASAVRKPGEVLSDPRLAAYEALSGTTGTPPASSGRNARVDQVVHRSQQ